MIRRKKKKELGFFNVIQIMKSLDKQNKRKEREREREKSDDMTWDVSGYGNECK